MSKYLRKFNDEAAYSAATIYIPSVSLIIENMTIKFDPISQYEYVDLGLPSGKKWATKNIGAESETDAGLYFQWGDTSGYTSNQISGGTKTFNWETYKFNPSGDGETMTKYQGTGEGKDGLTTLELVDDAARANMGDNWRMPTAVEYNELKDGTTAEWVTDYQGSGVNGMLFTSKVNGNTIFFPAAGNYKNKSNSYFGSNGCYWSSSVVDSNDYKAYYLLTNTNAAMVVNYARYYGYVIRGIMD